MTHERADSTRSPLLRPIWVGGLLSLLIATVAAIAMWSTALPVTPPDIVCAAIYPPTPGCAGEARILPATVWSVLAGLACAGTFLFGRRSWSRAAIWVAVTGVVGFIGYWATLYMRTFLIV